MQIVAFKNFRYAGSSNFDIDIGSGFLLFSITHSKATPVQARTILAADRMRADAFNLGADPESGAVTPGEMTCIRNLTGYIPQTWNEAISQLLDMQALMGTLLGYSYPVAIAYGRFLQMYSRIIIWLEFEIHHWHGWRLGPYLVTFHVQLAWHN
jgi:hypothetical protein